MLQTGIGCMKIPCYMGNAGCRWFIVKKAKIFWSYVKHFLFLAVLRKCRILIGICESAFFNSPTIFLDWHDKTKLVSASLSCFQDFNKENKVSCKAPMY